MTENITAIMVGVFQVILSINLIIRKKNSVAIASEIIFSLELFYILNGLSIKMTDISWRYIGLTIIEYLSVKIFLVIFMLIARYYSFYKIRALCSNNKENKSEHFKFIRAINNADYWPRLKLGLPGMAGKAHPVTKVKFDSKGFPKFKVYYTVKLRSEYFRESRERHFYMANKILYEDICQHARLKNMFSKKQIKEISCYKTPSGYTWHHHQDAGVLQLVDEEIHAKTYHYGGYSIWGGK